MTKRKFGLACLRNLGQKEKVKTPEPIVKEEVVLEESEEKKEETKKNQYRLPIVKDLPKDDYDFILGHAATDGKLAQGMTSQEYIDYLLHRDKLKKKEEE